MKKLMSLLMVMTLVGLSFVSCEKPGVKTPPELPPYESMAIDFSDFSSEKMAIEGISLVEGTYINHGLASINVLFFNTILTLNLVVPVTSFATALNQEPSFIGDATWQWSFTVDGFASAYSARLTGQVFDEYVEWKMYITKAGVGGHEEFMWYSGTSQNDGTSGQWILNHSNMYQEPYLQIDWEKDGAEMGEVKYTNIRELGNNRLPNPDVNSYIEAGRTADELDAYYNIFVAKDACNVDIEWSTTEFNGRIAHECFYGDDAWHCWDTLGIDAVCE